MRQRWVLVFLLAAVLPGMLLAQTSGTISGKVNDEENKPLAGADVTVSSDQTGIERSSTTNANGLFTFALLPVGNWTVTIEAPEYQPQVRSFRLGVGENVPVNVTLLRGEVAEEITVYSTATAMQQSASQTNIDYRERVEELPIVNRNINLVARMASHTSDAVQTAGDISIAGAPSMDTTVLLDGAEISDPFFGSGTTVYLEDAIEEVQVLTSGISARYGRFQGGIINAITKSGSNQFEATARFEFDKQSWNDQTPFEEVQSDTLNEIYQLTGGGYFWKDHVWFFGGYREIPASSVSRTTGFTQEAFNVSSVEDRWQGKIRVAPVANHIIDVSHLEFDATTDPWSATNLNPGHLQAATVGKRGDPRETNAASYQGVLTQNLFVELQATEKEVAIFAGGDPAGGNPFIDTGGGTLNVYNNYWWDASDLSIRNNETASGNLTYVLGTQSAGTHNLEGGVQYVNSITGGENKQTPTDINVVGNNADFVGAAFADGQPSFTLRNGQTARWTALPLGGGQELENMAAYVQDTFTIGKFRADVGLRYDDYEGSGPLPEFNMAFDDTAVRLGLAYNINDSWQVVGTWGEYVSRLNDNIVQNATNIGNAPRISHAYTGPTLSGLTAAQVNAISNDDSQWLTVTGFSGPDVTTSFLADNLKAPVAEDRTISLRYALPRNSGTMLVNFVHRSFTNLLDDYQGGVCDFTHFTFPASQPCPAANLVGIPNAAGVITSFVDSTVFANNPDAKREYEGVSFEGDYRPTARWNIGGSYTFSELVGNYEGEGPNMPANASQMGDFVRSQAQSAISPFGFMDEDIRHRYNIWGQYRFDVGRAGKIATSAVYRFNSGTRFDLRASVSRANDPLYASDANTTYTHFFTGRGSSRFEDFRAVDFGVRYDLPIFNKLGLWLKASVLNVLNEDALIRYQLTGSAETVNGVLTFVPSGTCGFDSEPATNPTCSSFKRIRNQADYQRPREYFFQVGLKY